MPSWPETIRSMLRTDQVLPEPAVEFDLAWSSLGAIIGFVILPVLVSIDGIFQIAYFSTISVNLDFLTEINFQPPAALPDRRGHGDDEGFRDVQTVQRR